MAQEDKKTQDGVLPLVFLHGLDREEAVKAMRAVKAALPERDIAFSMSTPTNVEWKVSDLIEEVSAEHRYMKQKPPQGAPDDPDYRSMD